MIWPACVSSICDSEIADNTTRHALRAFAAFLSIALLSGGTGLGQHLGVPEAGAAALVETARDLAGDALPQGAVARLGTTRFHFSDSLACVAVSPVSGLLAGTGHGGPVILWDPATGKAVRRLHTGRRTAHCVAFSPDGRWIVAGGLRDNQDHAVLQSWRLPSGEPGPPFDADSQDRIYHLEFSPDSQLLATVGGDRMVHLWDVMRGDELKMLEAPQIGRQEARCVAFSPDGQYLAAGADDGEVRIWDLAAQSDPIRIDAIRGSHVQSVVFMRDSDWLLVSGYESDNATGQLLGHIRAFDATTGEPKPFPLDGYRPMPGLVALSVCAEEARLAAVRPDRIELWEIATGKRLANITDYTNTGLHGPQAAAFSRDNRTLFAVSGFGDAAVRRWDVETGKELSDLPDSHVAAVTTLKFLNGGARMISSADDRTTRVWDTSAGRQLRKLNGRLVCVSPTGRRAALSDDWKYVRPTDEVQVVEPETGDELATLRTEGEWIGPGSFSQDGRFLAVDSYASKNKRAMFLETKEQTIHIWQVEPRKRLLQLLADPPHVIGIAFSTDGGLLSTASADGSVANWNLTTGKLVESFGRRNGIDTDIQAAFSSDAGMLIETVRATKSGRWTYHLALFDLVLQKRVHEFAIEDDAGDCLAISPDGLWLASAATWQRGDAPDTAVRIWDLTTGVEAGRIEPGPVFVTGLAFLPDDEQLATGMRDGTILIWKLNLAR